MLLCLSVLCTELDVCPHQHTDASKTRLQIGGNAPPQEAPPRCHTLGACFCWWHPQPGEGINCTSSIPCPQQTTHITFLDHRFKPTRLRQVRIYPGSISLGERDRNWLESLRRGQRHFPIEPPTPDSAQPCSQQPGMGASGCIRTADLAQKPSSLTLLKR